VALETRGKSRIGATIRGKWRVDAQLGRGSMATVYAATHRNGTRVALKMLHPHLSRDESVRTRFLREGYLANRVNHPGTVRITDDDVSEDGCAFLVMELLEGETLDQRRRSRGGTLPVADALAIFDELLDIVGAAHDQGLVHRDLKPDNIFLTAGGAVKVLDFGVANVWDGQRSSEMTMTGMVIGTPSFMPPEQALGRRDAVDKRSDLWALGACLFTAITGEPVHPEVGSAHLKILITAQQPARSIGAVLPNLPPAVVGLVDRALAFEKDHRFPDARAMKRALAEARADLAGAPDSMSERTRIRPDAASLARALDDRARAAPRANDRADRDPATMRELPSITDDDEPSTERMGIVASPEESVVTSAPVFPLVTPAPPAQAAKSPTQPAPPIPGSLTPPPPQANLVPSAFPPHTPFGRSSSPPQAPPPNPHPPDPRMTTGAAFAQTALAGVPAAASPLASTSMASPGPAMPTSAGAPVMSSGPPYASAPPYAPVPSAPRVPHFSTPHAMTSGPPAPLRSQLEAPPPMTGGGLRFLVPVGLVAAAIVGGYVLYARRLPRPAAVAAASASVRPSASGASSGLAGAASGLASATATPSAVAATAPSASVPSPPSAAVATVPEPLATAAVATGRPRVRPRPQPSAAATAEPPPSAAPSAATPPTTTASAPPPPPPTATDPKPQPLLPTPPADPE